MAVFSGLASAVSLSLFLQVDVREQPLQIRPRKPVVGNGFIRSVFGMHECIPYGYTPESRIYPLRVRLAHPPPLSKKGGFGAAHS